MMTKSSEILHLYIGQETTQGKIINIDIFHNECFTLKNSEIFKHKPEQIKLLLRKVDSMTITECDTVTKILKSEQYFTDPLIFNYGQLTKYYLSIGIDLFNLIETGEAINKL